MLLTGISVSINYDNTLTGKGPDCVMHQQEVCLQREVKCHTLMITCIILRGKDTDRQTAFQLYIVDSINSKTITATVYTSLGGLWSLHISY